MTCVFQPTFKNVGLGEGGNFELLGNPARARDREIRVRFFPWDLRCGVNRGNKTGRGRRGGLKQGCSSGPGFSKVGPRKNNILSQAGGGLVGNFFWWWEKDRRGITRTRKKKTYKHPHRKKPLESAPPSRTLPSTEFFQSSRAHSGLRTAGESPRRGQERGGWYFGRGFGAEKKSSRGKKKIQAQFFFHEKPGCCRTLEPHSWDGHFYPV